MSAPSASSSFPFADRGRRALAQQLGMWAFLATEILFFGGLFLAYAVYRSSYPGAFAAGSGRLEFWAGTLNTGLLLASSWLVALADGAARKGNRAGLRALLAGAWLLGAGFLGVKAYEYHAKFVEHLVPGAAFAPGATAPPAEQLFFVLYFAMTGLHALHMIAGLSVLGWVGWRACREDGRTDEIGRVEVAGLYWHFVDCVWVFLYPLLYLIR